MGRVTLIRGWGCAAVTALASLVAGTAGSPVLKAESFEAIAQTPLAEPAPFGDPAPLHESSDAVGSATPAISEEALEPLGVGGAPRIDRLAAPNWTRYSYAEALIMGRDNQAFNRPLVVDALTDTQVLGTQDLQFPYGGGLRAFYGALGPDCRGWEVGYFGLYNLTATAVAPTAPDTYAFPNGFGAPQSLSDTATITNDTTINSVEANMFHHFERWNFYREAWLEVDWLTGFRYVGVEENAEILMLCCGGTDSYLYRLGSRNNMFGGQIGGRARLNWQRWAVEGWGKAALLGNAAEQYQDPVVSTISGPIRDGISSSGTTVGMVADLNISAIYRLTEVWGIRAGFNTIWLGGTALALDQFDFSSSTTGGGVLQEGGSLFLNGVNLGLEGRW